MNEGLYFYFQVKNQTKDKEKTIGENLTNDELKSIDESDKIESGENRNQLIKAYLGVIILAVLLALDIYHDINLYGELASLCILIITLQIFRNSNKKTNYSK